MLGVLLRLLAPARVVGGISAAVTTLLFAVGAALALCWLRSSLGGPLPAAIIGCVIALGALAIFDHRFSRTRGVALGLLVIIHVFWLYISVTLGALLAWTTGLSVRLVVAVLAVAAIRGASAARPRFRIPTALPLGIWIAACLIGWLREDGLLRCDDYLAMRRVGVEVLVPTTDALATCQPGTVLRIGHYPRHLWEPADGGRLVITTQRGSGAFAPRGQPVADRLPGIVCDVPFNGAPLCFGGGKAQAIVESSSRDNLFIPGWQQQFSDGKRGVLYILPRTAPLHSLAEVHLQENVVGLFYDRVADTVGVLSDEGEVLRPVRLSDGAVLDPIPAPIVPDETRYDEASGEGVFCFGAGLLRRLDGEAFLSVAFRGHPFSTRPLGGSRENPAAWLSMVWGCDWDPIGRRVYVAEASLGLLTVLDYDSGRVLHRLPIDFGVRYVTVDNDRGLVYLANFLRGDVIALDLATGAEVGRWFAGRFVRQVVLARDRQSLLATSNLGVVRIPLDGLRARTPNVFHDEGHEDHEGRN